MRMTLLKASSLALALLLSPAAARAVEVFRSDNASLDFGARFQLQGTLEYTGNTSYVAPVPVSMSTGHGNRDAARIYLFQKQNRLRLDGELEGIRVKFENAMGSEATAGGNNLYDLMEFSAEVPLNENISVVAGLAKMPWNHASAVYEQASLFTDRSELFNLFFNAGSDTTVYLKSRFGLLDASFGLQQGAGNLAQRYIPETLMFPLPMFLRVGVGNLQEDPARFRQIGFEQPEEAQWALHANGFWAADSGAGHGTLFGQMATQAANAKGPFYNGNFLTSRDFNPFAGYTTGPGGLARPDNQIWTLSVDSQMRVPMGNGTLVGGGQWVVTQYIAKGMHSSAIPGERLGNQPFFDGKTYTYGQITVQGGEAYLGYLTGPWALATRVNVLLPDPLLGKVVGVGANRTLSSYWGSTPQWEITFPSITYQINRYAKLVGETELSYAATEVVDTNGVYQLKTVPTTPGSYVTATNPVQRTWTNGKGRMMMQVAF